MKKRLQFLLAVVILISGLVYFSGYRLTGLQAAKTNSFVPKDAILLDQVDYSWGSVYILDSSEKPITAISHKKLGFLWVSRASSYFFHNNDPVKTIGGMIVSDQGKEATVFSVLVNDSQVAFIEAGAEGERQRKNVVLGEPVTFSWDKPIFFHDLNPLALDQAGNILYEYRYASPTYTRSEDLKWYAVDSNS